MVDQSPFFAKFESVQPFLIPKEKHGEGEYIQSPEDREAIDDATKCILCQSCVSACPVMEKNPNFIGPAAIVQAFPMDFVLEAMPFPIHDNRPLHYTLEPAPKSDR